MLRCLQFLSCLRYWEKSGSVNLREALEHSGPRRPFQFKCVALQRPGFVPVAGKRPGMNDLSALLFDRAQLDEITPRLEAGFLLELANGGRKQFFVRPNLAFGNAPVTLIFVFEQRSAGLREEKLQL